MSFTVALGSICYILHGVRQAAYFARKHKQTIVLILIFICLGSLSVSVHPTITRGGIQIKELQFQPTSDFIKDLEKLTNEAVISRDGPGKPIVIPTSRVLEQQVNTSISGVFPITLGSNVPQRQKTTITPMVTKIETPKKSKPVTTPSPKSGGVFASTNRSSMTIKLIPNVRLQNGVKKLAPTTTSNVDWADQWKLKSTTGTIKPPKPTESEQRHLSNALIIGAQKAGTSALYRFLDHHPDIVAGANEVHFFDINEHYERGVNWYKEQLPPSKFGQVVIEKSPAYFQKSNFVPERVFMYNSTIKLLLILRDPVKRIVSHFVHRSLSLEQKQLLKDYVLNDHGVVNYHSRLVNTSMYYDRVKEWLEWFPLSQFHFISGEEFIKNPASVLQGVESFLGVQHFFQKKHFVMNEQKGFYCLNVSSVVCLGSTKGRKHPNISVKVLQKLLDFFNPLNEKLYRITGKRFNWPTTLPTADPNQQILEL